MDDQELLRAGFRMVLEEAGDMSVVGEAGDGAEAVRLASRLRPDVILMDVRMPGTDGIEATRRVVAETPSSRVLILTTFDLDEYAFTALRYGASGFLLKDVPPAELIGAVRAVAAGDAVVAPSVTRRLLDAYASQLPDLRAGEERTAPPPGLDVLTDPGAGDSRRGGGRALQPEIAAKLYVAEATVKTHLGRILTKLELRDRVQAVVLAYQSGLVRPGH